MLEYLLCVARSEIHVVCCKVWYTFCMLLGLVYMLCVESSGYMVCVTRLGTHYVCYKVLCVGRCLECKRCVLQGV